MASHAARPTRADYSFLALAHLLRAALLKLVDLGWVWPNVGFSIASGTAYLTYFPFTATLLLFVLFVRLVRFPEGEMRRSDAMASGTMVNLPTCETHYEWLEPVGGATEAAEVVVLAHGFSGESGHLRGLAHEVRKAGFRALIYDLVGRGYSSCRDVNHTAHLFVSQLNELMDTLEVREFHLVGLSLGGGVAVSFAQYFPKRVKSLTLIAAVGLKMSSKAHILTRMPLLPDFMFRMLLWQTVLAGLEYEWSDESDPKFAMMVESYKERVAREPAFGRSLLSSARHFPLEQLQAAYEAAGAADRPTLLVWGDDDRTCPIENAREIQQKYIARAELIVVRGARHCVYTEYVAEVAHAP